MTRCADVLQGLKARRWAWGLMLLVLMAGSAAPTAAQEKEYRYELGGGVGLGWSYGERNDHAPIGNTGLWAGLVWRYNLNLRWALATELQSTGLGDTRFWQLNVRPEVAFWNYGWGSDYREKRRYAPFLTMGLAGGVATGGPDGNAWTVGVPLGVGMKYKFSPRLNGQLTALFTKTFSDKVDGIADPEGIATSGMVGNDWVAALQLTLTFDFGERCEECRKAY